MNKQVLDQQSLVSDKTVNKNSVLESAKCVQEVTEIEKVLALAVEEGSGVAADFQEGKCSFILSAEDLPHGVKENILSCFWIFLMKIEVLRRKC